jgi:hypothetical protein
MKSATSEIVAHENKLGMVKIEGRNDAVFFHSSPSDLIIELDLTLFSMRYCSAHAITDPHKIRPLNSQLIR